jgi:hypothetical protein
MEVIKPFIIENILCFLSMTEIMNYLLSWYNFQPFARLSFGFFMIHFMVIFRRIFTVRETVVMYDSVMVSIKNSIQQIPKK